MLKNRGFVLAVLATSTLLLSFPPTKQEARAARQSRVREWMTTTPVPTVATSAQFTPPLPAARPVHSAQLDAGRLASHDAATSRARLAHFRHRHTGFSKGMPRRAKHVSWWHQKQAYLQQVWSWIESEAKRLPDRLKNPQVALSIGFKLIELINGRRAALFTQRPVGLHLRLADKLNILSKCVHEIAPYDSGLLRAVHEHYHDIAAAEGWYSNLLTQYKAYPEDSHLHRIYVDLQRRVRH